MYLTPLGHFVVLNLCILFVLIEADGEFRFVKFLVLFSKALVSQVMIIESGLGRLLLKDCIFSVFLRY